MGTRPRRHTDRLIAMRSAWPAPTHRHASASPPCPHPPAVPLPGSPPRAAPAPARPTAPTCACFPKCSKPLRLPPGPPSQFRKPPRPVAPQFAPSRPSPPHIPGRRSSPADDRKTRLHAVPRFHSSCDSTPAAVGSPTPAPWRSAPPAASWQSVRPAPATPRVIPTPSNTAEHTQPKTRQSSAPQSRSRCSASCCSWSLLLAPVRLLVCSSLQDPRAPRPPHFPHSIPPFLI